MPWCTSPTFTADFTKQDVCQDSSVKFADGSVSTTVFYPMRGHGILEMVALLPYKTLRINTMLRVLTM